MVLSCPSKLWAQIAWPVSVDLSRALIRMALPARCSEPESTASRPSRLRGLDRGGFPHGFSSPTTRSEPIWASSVSS